MDLSELNNSSQCASSCAEDPITPPQSQTTRYESIRSPSRSRRQLICGYDCEFVDPAPTLIQTECPICLLILREPYLIGCCGHNFCKVCVEQVKAKNMPCPLCGEDEYGILPNKGLQRSINELKVECSQKKLGCPWTGELGSFSAHLNQEYDSNTQLEGCSFVEVECKHGCGGKFLRNAVAEHQTDKCLQRPFCCDYCREYKSIHADVVHRHWPVCKAYPLRCPNQCTVYAIERQNMEHHLEHECPLKVIECELQYAGCNVRLPRQDMPEHRSKSYILHMSLLSSLNQKLVDDLSIRDDEFVKFSDEVSSKLLSSEREIEQLRQENALLKLALAEMKSEMQRMFGDMKQSIAELQVQPKIQEEKMNKQSEMCQLNVDALNSKLDSVKSDLSFHCYLIQAHMGLFPVTFNLTDFKTLFESGTDWVSPPFRSSRDGYRLCLVVNCKGSAGFVSVYACLMQGDCDDSLSWPFRGEITVQLLNQLSDRHHATGTIRFTEFTPLSYATREYGPGHKPKGWGQQKFIGHHELDYNDVKKRQYLLRDNLCFRISRVEVSQK